ATPADVYASWKSHVEVASGSARIVLRSSTKPDWGYKILHPGNPFGDTAGNGGLRYPDYWENNQSTEEWKQYKGSDSWPKGIRMPRMLAPIQLPRPSYRGEIHPPFGPVLPVQIVTGKPPHQLKDQRCSCPRDAAWSGCYSTHLSTLPGIHEVNDLLICSGELYVLDAG